MATPSSEWKPQVVGGGNNIPDTYLKRFGTFVPKEESPDSDELSKFIRDQL
jgi:hypothetical protein